MGIVIAIAGCAYGFYLLKKSEKKLLEMQSMQTSSIADALEVVDSLADTNPNYRHYAEIKGTLCCDEPLTTPYTEQPVSYYHAVCKAVNETTRQERRDNGEMRTITSKEENTLSDETRTAKCFIKDTSSEVALYVNIESFGSHLDAESSCDRMERENSPFITNNRGYFDSYSSSYRNRGSNARFLGFRLIEKTFGFNRPVYCLGEIYKIGNEYHIEASAGSDKSSVLTHKSEEMMVESQNKSKLMSMGIMAAAVVIGIVVMFI